MIDDKLINEGVVLTTTQLIPSMVTIDNSEKTKYSAFAYVSENFLHIRLFDGTSNECEPYFTFNGKKIYDARFWFKVNKNDKEIVSYEFFSDNDNHLSFTDGSEVDYEPISHFRTCPNLILGAKIIFIDLIWYIINKNDAVIID